MFRLRLFLILVLICLLIAAGFQYVRPLPKLQPSIDPIEPIPAQSVNLPWPAYGQAAVAESTFGPLSSHGEQKAEPMASTAKIITALAVLKQKPLSKGEQGPTITLSDADVAIYNDYVSKQGSVVKVVAGEQLSEYQAMQAMLLASANNIADTLANWAFGSMDAYVNSANLLAAQYQANNTKVVGASGFMAGSVSTAEDLVKLGQALMNNPVAAEIVSQKEAVIPVAGKIQNYNSLLGNDGVVGVKTGNTDEAGGCFVWAAQHIVFGQKLLYVGAEMGAPTRQQAITDSQALIRTLDQNFTQVTVIKKGQTVGRYDTPWNTSADIIAKDNLSFIYWKGQKLNIGVTTIQSQNISKAGTEVGKIIVPLGGHVAEEPVILKSDLARPPISWRLLR